MPSDVLPLVALPVLGALGLLLIAWAATILEARSLRKRAQSTRARRTEAFGTRAPPVRHAAQRGDRG
jgi:hypothetical protein